MSTKALFTILIALMGCGSPEPDNAIVTVYQLGDHPGHPCTPLLPEPDGARRFEYDDARTCTVEHCIARVAELDPERDMAKLHDLCVDGLRELGNPLEGCQLAACERLLPVVPGIAYPVSSTTAGLLETEAWAGPISESSPLFTEILELGPKTSCAEVLRLAALLETMVIKGQQLPWDLHSARATLRLARWHHQGCPRYRGSFAELLELIPDDTWDQLMLEEGGAG